MKQSTRHHYVPEFYLKGFTSEKGTFKIFDVEKSAFVKNGKDFNPSSFFFIPKDNTMSLNNLETDKLENDYSKIDNKIANIFNKINDNKEYKLSNEEIINLEYFIGILYWRLPVNKQKFERLFNDRRIIELGLRVEDKRGNIINDEDIVNLWGIKNFIKMIKLSYSEMEYSENIITQKETIVLKFSGTLFPICSDNPILSLNPEKFRIHNDNYIFPLNYKNILVSGKNYKTPTSNALKTALDILIMKQAIKYVSCTNIDYLKSLLDVYDTEFKNMSNLREFIFSELFES